MRKMNDGVEQLAEMVLSEQGRQGMGVQTFTNHLPTLLEGLLPKERRLIELRFGLLDQQCRSFKELVIELDLRSTEKVAELRSRAIQKMKQRMRHLLSPAHASPAMDNDPFLISK